MLDGMKVAFLALGHRCLRDGSWVAHGLRGLGRRAYDRVALMLYWLKVALQDLFPTRGFRPFSLISWLPGLALVLAVTAAVGLGIAFESAIAGAREILDDPIAFRKILVRPRPFSGKAALDPDQIRSIEELRLPLQGAASAEQDPSNGTRGTGAPPAGPGVRVIEQVFPYITMLTSAYVGGIDQALRRDPSLEKRLPSVRTVRQDDPVLTGLRWDPDLYGPGPAVERPFETRSHWGIIVSKELLLYLGLYQQSRDRLGAFVQARNRVAAQTVLTATERVAVLTAIQSRQERDCRVPLTLLIGGQTKECTIPLLGIVEYVPGAPLDLPESIVLESFFTDLHNRQQPLDPNPLITQLELSGLSLDEIERLRRLADDHPAIAFRLRWKTYKFKKAVEVADILLFATALPPRTGEVWLDLPVETSLSKVLDYLKTTGKVDVEQPAPRYSPEPQVRLLSGRPSDRYTYADVYVKKAHQESYQDLVDRLKSLGLGVDVSQHDNIVTIRRQLAFMRARADEVLVVINLATAVALMLLQMLLAHFRVKETAVFRAHGAGAGLIVGVHAGKGLIIWAIGSLLGVALGVSFWFASLRGWIGEALRRPVLDNHALAAALGGAWWPIGQTLLACLVGASLACLFALGISNPARVIRN